jgi:hypothetical protein
MLLLPQNRFIPFYRGCPLGQQFTLSGNTSKSVLVVTVAGPTTSCGCSQILQNTILCTFTFLWNILRRCQSLNWRMMNWKVFERKRSWSCRGTMLTFAWTDWEKPLRTSADILDEFRTYHLPVTASLACRSNPQIKMQICLTDTICSLIYFNWNKTYILLLMFNIIF